ncbi:MAG: hypothetical protein R3E45_12080 [Rhodocyclaceae bacterium]|nr:hypothetical protein [Rhodocyclaceae bacterium]MCP5232346.1 hypothetical protein [Zoogloeaceae bacterium]MCP5241142.1 hypothetical protein [Zoogloeaceae bacterium]MCP5254946.1 hypothetical protein [Zoogloeaceae bacterium]MCP5295402.1 hypothetical protein [Zoogloeaceae bacterium]
MRPIEETKFATSLRAALVPLGVAGMLSMTFASPALAQPAGGGRKGPPAEALAACKSLASGDACEFDGPQGKASGTCFAPQQGMALACRPKDAPAQESDSKR